MPRPDYESNDLAGAAHYAADDVSFDDRPTLLDILLDEGPDSNSPESDWESLADKADSGALR